jgi:ParB family chromosome partitioning protein
MTRLASKARKGAKAAARGAAARAAAEAQGKAAAHGAAAQTQGEAAQRAAAETHDGAAGQLPAAENPQGAAAETVDGAAGGGGAGLASAQGVPPHGAVISPALSRLKRSPRNARKTPHSAAHIEALAGSIAAKGMLQKPVVEPERDEGGALTGFWLVTIGEGRRLAQLLRVERGEIGPDEPVSCVLDLANDPEEISLDENVTREELHPLDQVEAFLDQSQRLGRSAEEIAARFGVSPVVVRRRLRLARVSPVVRQAYREGQIDMEVLMAFAVSEDQRRQEEVFAGLPPYNVGAAYIRRMMTETKVPAWDRRAEFVGIEAYEAAGGAVLRDLFTEDRGGWLEDVPLLERLTLDKLAGEAERVRKAEGWKWAEAHIDYPHHLGFARVYPEKVEPTEAEAARRAALATEYDALLEQWDHLDEPPPEVAARLDEIDAELQGLGDGYAYAPEDVARAGVFVVLGHDSDFRVERGFIRPEDAARASGGGGEGAEDGAADGGEAGDPSSGASARLSAEGSTEAEGPDAGEPKEDAGAPISAALVAELSAYRTAGLRDALAENPDAALAVAVHALALQVFYSHSPLTCADLRLTTTHLRGYASDVEESPALRRMAERREAWARDLPQNPAELWACVAGLGRDSLMALLAVCAAESLNAVRSFEHRPGAWAHADDLAAHLKLDMTSTWTATAASFFGRVTKARIAEAVREAVSPEAAERMAGLKKEAMAQAAEALVAGKGWLPGLLRTPGLAPAGDGEGASALPEEVGGDGSADLSAEAGEGTTPDAAPEATADAAEPSPADVGGSSTAEAGQAEGPAGLLAAE